MFKSILENDWKKKNNYFKGKENRSVKFKKWVLILY